MNDFGRMFNFLNDTITYESRKVGRYDSDDGGMYVSTASVTDGQVPYETGVKHPDYHDGVIVVEAYETRDAALAGHEKWVKTMTTEPLPESLTDVCNGLVGAFGQALGFEKPIYKRKTKQ